MHLHGGTIAGVAKATAALKDDDRSRPWREFVNVWNDTEGTHFIGSDGLIVARVSISQDSAVKGCLRRVDALRFTKKDAVHIDEVGGGTKRRHVISVDGSDVTCDLQPNDGKGDALRQSYEEKVDLVFDNHPEGRPAIRCDAKMLRRALGCYIAAGGESVEVFVAPSAGQNGMIFLSGQDDGGAAIDVALGIPTTAERKSKTGEVVEFLEPSPLFAGAEAPPKADPTLPPPVDGKTAAAGKYEPVE